MTRGNKAKLDNSKLAKLEPHKLAQTFEQRWVRIDDVEYDVTNFKHPGGSVIFYMLSNTGADATEAFKEFHMRSPKAWKMLKALPQRPAETPRSADPDAPMLQDFARWRAELEKEGFFEPSRLHLAYRCLELCATFALGTFLMYIGRPLLASIVYGAFFARALRMGPARGRAQLAHRLHLVGQAHPGGDLRLRPQHFRRHVEPDAQQAPRDATEGQARHGPRHHPRGGLLRHRRRGHRPRGFSKTWARAQAWTFVPVTSGVLVQMFWIYVLHPRQVLRKKNYEEASWMFLSHVVRTAVIKLALGCGTAEAYGWFWVGNWIAYMYLFAHFSTSHTHLDVVPSDKHISWVNYAVDHTVDINPRNSIVNWLMGYLNCQVIHHLFPDMPQFRQPEVSRRFVAFAEKWNLNYKVLTYYGAWKATFSNLDRVGQHYYVNGKAKAH